MGKSYYESMCEERGIKLPFYVVYVRNADKDAAAKRRRLLNKMKEGVE